MFKQDQNLLHEYLELTQCPYEVNVKIQLHQYYYVRECNRIDMNKSWRSAQQYILDHTYISDYEWLFDTITIKGNIEEIISSFEILSKQQIFTKNWRIETNEDEEYSEINFDSQQNQKMFWTLSEHIVNEIEKAILIKFQQFEQKCTYTTAEIPCYIQIFFNSLCRNGISSIISKQSVTFGAISNLLVISVIYYQFYNQIPFLSIIIYLYQIDILQITVFVLQIGLIIQLSLNCIKFQ